MSEGKTLEGKFTSTKRVPCGSPTPATSIWGIDWTKEFPKKLTQSIYIEYIRYDKAAAHIADLFPEVYRLSQSNSRFISPTNAEAKKRYYEENGDFFLFRDELNSGTVAGLAACTMLDWSSYNFRNIAVAPNYQEQGLYFKFFEVLSDILIRHRVARIEGDVAPSNKHHIQALMKMGYMPVGTSLSEQFGALIHIAKYLNSEEEEVFTDLFSVTSASDKHSNGRFTRKKGA